MAERPADGAVDAEELIGQWLAQLVVDGTLTARVAHELMHLDNPPPPTGPEGPSRARGPKSAQEFFRGGSRG